MTINTDGTLWVAGWLGNQDSILVRRRAPGSGGQWSTVDSYFVPGSANSISTAISHDTSGNVAVYAFGLTSSTYSGSVRIFLTDGGVEDLVTIPDAVMMGGGALADGGFRAFGYNNPAHNLIGYELGVGRNWNSSSTGVVMVGYQVQAFDDGGVLVNGNNNTSTGAMLAQFIGGAWMTDTRGPGIFRAGVTTSSGSTILVKDFIAIPDAGWAGAIRAPNSAVWSDYGSLPTTGAVWTVAETPYGILAGGDQWGLAQLNSATWLASAPIGQGGVLFGLTSNMTTTWAVGVENNAWVVKKVTCP